MFQDRSEAGRRLAEALQQRADLRGGDVVVLGLPRGGVPVAAEVADVLGAPLDVLVVRKLGVPGHRELAMGAIGEGGVRVLDPATIRHAGVHADDVAAVEAEERTELQRRAQRFRAGRARVPLAGRVALIVDDGLATGSTAKAACQVARRQGAARVVVAVPVAPAGAGVDLVHVADELVVLEQPTDFQAVGRWYQEFDPTPDQQVVRLLHDRADRARRAPLAEQVHLPADGVQLEGELVLPPDPQGVVVFAHGSGSSRHSPRNRAVARELVAAGFGVLLFDLLTADEDGDRVLVFDVALLGRRLGDVVRWIRGHPSAGGLPVALFGASTGAAAALRAAAEPDLSVVAVVSRGGRPDLAGERLADVHCPVLLVVGSRDDWVLERNRQAQAQLGGDSRLSVVPGATHLFEEPGALGEVTDLAISWLLEHLVHRGAQAVGPCG